MGALFHHQALMLLQAIAFAWPASQAALHMHTPQPIPPVDDDEDDDDDGSGGGSGGGNIDPDDDEGGSDDDDDDDEDTLWTAREPGSARMMRSLRQAVLCAVASEPVDSPCWR